MSGFNPLLEPPTGESGKSALKQWAGLVEKFTDRNLTVATDRLPAILGLIAHFESRLAWTNIFGLWKEHLTMEMLWSITGVNTRARVGKECADMVLDQRTKR
jgi:hypothetical protein